jgi:hypothetical protein
LKHITAILALMSWGILNVDDVHAAGRTSGVEVLHFDKSLLSPKHQLRGEIVGGARWLDLQGENVLVLTQTGSLPSHGRYVMEDSADAELYAYHYIIRGNDAKLLWTLKDFQRDCPFDLYAGFILKSLSVTDLDSDGVAESTFLYKLSCRSDVSPAGLKLIMHEGKDKYAIRGSTKLPEGYGGGDMKLDAAFKSAGKPFKRFAIELWNKFVAEDDFEHF